MKLPSKRGKTTARRSRVSEDSRIALSYQPQRLQPDESVTPADRSAQAMRRLSRRLWRGSTMLGLLVVLVVLVNLLTLVPTAQVLPLTAGGRQSFLRSTASYQAAASKLLASSPWNRNKITIDTGRLSHDLENQFPELDSVSVTLPLLGHRPTFYVQTAQPSMVLVASNGSFVLDSRGKALLSGTPSSLANYHVPVVTDQSGIQAHLNHQALPTEDVTFISTIQAELAARSVTVASWTLPAGTSELDAQIASKPYVAKFNLQNNDPRQQAGTFLATQAQLQKQGITPTRYIDVRVDGRAYYQ